MMEDFQMEETNNYERWCEQWREKFLKMDQEELKKRLPELKEEGDWLTICHFGRRLGIHKENGMIIAMEDHDPVTCYERLNVYTLFGYVSPLARYKDDWAEGYFTFFKSLPGRGDRTIFQNVQRPCKRTVPGL